MYRMETDFLGEKSVPAEAYYGIHTIRAVENFDVSRQKVHPELLRALAVVKQAAAESNISIGVLDKNIGSAIFQAAEEMLMENLRRLLLLMLSRAVPELPLI